MRSNLEGPDGRTGLLHQKNGCALTHQHVLSLAPFMLMAGRAGGRFRDQSPKLELTGVCENEVDSFKTLGSHLPVRTLRSQCVLKGSPRLSSHYPHPRFWLLLCSRH